MSYLVLARKYRPTQFLELVGQQHVATTLLNAFKQNKLGQAYLFTGTRGVGKTSVARILAKVLRCESPDAQPGGKSPGISCDKCASCLEIIQGSSMDVLEIDGASNNGVENVREIREQVKFLPSRGSKRVYIVDEVHMLSNSAFNALLKTLEEPPAHVTFILATTEVQKIPPTILSRCQRFDFRRVPMPLISDHLARIAQLEGIQAEPAAIRLIARKADGSLRDSLSALDQCLALGGSSLTAQGAGESLGIVSDEFLLKVLGHALRRELVPAAELVQKAFLGGVEMKQIAIGLAETLRNALFVKFRAGPELAEISAEEKAAYEELASPLSPEAIQAAYRSMIASLEEITRSPLPRASLEMALARLAGIGHLRSLEELISRLEGGALPASAAAPSMAAPASAPPAQAALTAAKPAPAPMSAAPAPKVSIPVFRIPNADPVTQPEKKTPEPAPAPLPGGGSFSAFVSHVFQNKASLGAILEHALPVTPDPEWKTAGEIRIGFRKSHSFYKLQAEHKANFGQLEQLLQQLVGRKAALKIELVDTTAAAGSPVVSIVEKERQSAAQANAEKKKKFLEHEVVRHTKEIFGAELSSFDIDNSKS